jgi:hypothetical protein
MQMQGKRMRFFYNDDAEAMRKDASQCSISASWFGAQKKEQVTGGEKRSYEGGEWRDL